MSTYTDIQNACLVAMAAAGYPYAPSTLPPDWQTVFPQATQYAEQRITQEVPLLGNRQQLVGNWFTDGATNTFSLSTLPLPITVVEGFALFSPAGTTGSSGGTRIVFEETSLDAINTMWPKVLPAVDPSTAMWLGRYWAMLNAETIIYAPTAPANFLAEVTALFVPNALSSGEDETYLSMNYPSLYECGCLIFLAAAYKRNASAASDDPQMSVTWENQFTRLKAAAEFEEKRRRGLLPDEPMQAPPPAPPMRR